MACIRTESFATARLGRNAWPDSDAASGSRPGRGIPTIVRRSGILTFDASGVVNDVSSGNACAPTRNLGPRHATRKRKARKRAIRLTFDTLRDRIESMPSQHTAGVPEHAKIIVVIPTYNEAENLPGLVAELHALAVPGMSVLVVDDNSPDGTGQVADCLAERLPGVVAGHAPAAARTGWAALMSQGSPGPWPMAPTTSSRWTPTSRTRSECIPTMLGMMRDYDVVVGSRYVTGGQLDERWSWWRRFLSWWANEVWSRHILGLNARRHHGGVQVLAPRRHCRASGWTGSDRTGMRSRSRWPT